LTTILNRETGEHPTFLSKEPTMTRHIVALLMPLTLVSIRAPAAEDIPADQFAQLHRLIRRQPGEQEYLNIRWVADPWEAQQKAAAESKPILVFSHVGDPLGHL
jgi:hypothetical protein